MRRFDVEFSERAITNLESSFEWGCKHWGVEQAVKWYFEFRDEIELQLSRSPLGYPLTADQLEYDVEVRQIVIGRYHVLYSLNEKLVTVLHIRGARR